MFLEKALCNKHRISVMYKIRKNLGRKQGALLTMVNAVQFFPAELCVPQRHEIQKWTLHSILHNWFRGNKIFANFGHCGTIHFRKDSNLLPSEYRLVFSILQGKYDYFLDMPKTWA